MTTSQVKCPCGALYERTEFNAPPRETDRFCCSVCGEILEIFRLSVSNSALPAGPAAIAEATQAELRRRQGASAGRAARHERSTAPSSHTRFATRESRGKTNGPERANRTGTALVGGFLPVGAAGGLTGSIDSTLRRTSSSARSKRTAPASGEVAGALREGDKSPVTIRPRKSVTGQKDRHATYSDPQLVVRS